MRHKASASKTERKSFNEPSLDWAHIVLYASLLPPRSPYDNNSSNNGGNRSNSNCNNNESCQQIARKSHKPFTTTTAQRNAASSMMLPSLFLFLAPAPPLPPHRQGRRVVNVLPPATITKRFLCTAAALLLYR